LAVKQIQCRLGGLRGEGRGVSASKSEGDDDHQGRRVYIKGRGLVGGDVNSGKCGRTTEKVYRQNGALGKEVPGGSATEVIDRGTETGGF